MILYIPKSEREDITNLFQSENVAFEISGKAAIRETGGGSYEVLAVTANLLEIQVPPLYRSSEGDMRAFRLPSGKLILTDLEGNLEQITNPAAGN